MISIKKIGNIFLAKKNRKYFFNVKWYIYFIDNIKYFNIFNNLFYLIWDHHVSKFNCTKPKLRVENYKEITLYKCLPLQIGKTIFPTTQVDMSSSLQIQAKEATIMIRMYQGILKLLYIFTVSDNIHHGLKTILAPRTKHVITCHTPSSPLWIHEESFMNYLPKLGLVSFWPFPNRSFN